MVLGLSCHKSIHGEEDFCGGGKGYRKELKLRGGCSKKVKKGGQIASGTREGHAQQGREKIRGAREGRRGKEKRAQSAFLLRGGFLNLGGSGPVDGT